MVQKKPGPSHTKRVEEHTSSGRAGSTYRKLPTRADKSVTDARYIVTKNNKVRGQSTAIGGKVTPVRGKPQKGAR